MADVVMGFIFAALFTPPGAPTAEPVGSEIFMAIGYERGFTIAIAAGLGPLGGIVGRAISARKA